MPESKCKVPERRCVGCMESKAQSQLFRIAKTPDGIVIDTEGRSPGRGCYICKNRECIDKAVKKNGFAKSLRSTVNKDELQRISQVLSELL